MKPHVPSSGVPPDRGQHQRQHAIAFQPQPQQYGGPVKKSAGSFFEKHAFGVGNPNQVLSQGSGIVGGPLPSKVVAKIPAASSTYNMHRQNATRGDSNSAHLAHTGANAANSNMATAPNQNQLHNSQVSREKPTTKQFSQNMLSKSQKFASLQFSQAVLSQQSYLAQGHLAAVNSGQAAGGIPLMQKQNFIGQGTLGTNASPSLNTSPSQQMNSSAHYEAVVAANSSSEQAQQSIRGLQRKVSKTSLEKRKSTAIAAPIQGLVAYSQPTERTDGAVTHSSQSKVGLGVLPPSSQTSMAQKRYSINSVSGGLNALGATHSTGGLHSALAIQNAASQSQLANHNVLNSESTNKLRRISNMKQKHSQQDMSGNHQSQLSNTDQRNSNLMQVQIQPMKGTVNGLAQKHAQATGFALLQASASANIIPQKGSISTTSNLAGPGVPANMSNLTSFQQSHSERTSVTDEAQTRALIALQWPSSGTNQHALCSTERYSNNDQKGSSHHQKRYMQQIQHIQKSETFGSQPHDTYQASSGATSSGQTPSGMFSNKSNKEQQFFVTDHKIYEDESNMAISGDAGSGDMNSCGINDTSMLRPKAPSYHLHHQNGVPVNVMQYDIEVEEIKVNSMGQQPQSTKNQSLYLSNKACRKQQLIAANSSSVLPSATASLEMQQLLGQSQHEPTKHTRGAAAAPISTKHSTQSGQKHLQQQHQSIVCPIYQSKDFRLMTGQQTQSTKNSFVQSSFTGSKKDQKDVKRASHQGERKDNKNSSQNSCSAARRSMSDDMHEDVYMAKTYFKKPRKRPFKATSMIETHSNGSQRQSSSVSSSQDTYERSYVKKNGLLTAQQPNRQSKAALVLSASKDQQWHQREELLGAGESQSVSNREQQQIYSETGSAKSICQERREAEPLADKLLYLTNQACQSKVKSKSHLTQSVKGIRKGIKSPSGSQSTLQEPSAKAMPTSSKVKISQKFNKFEQSNPAMKMTQAYSNKQNLFSTKTLKKQGSGPLQELKEQFKSPDCRHLQMKKTGSISYAILPRQVIGQSELKAQKKMKSPSPSIKLQGAHVQHDQLQRMRSPQTIKAQSFVQSAQKSQNQSVLDNRASVGQNLSTKQMKQQMFESRRLSQQQRISLLSQKPPHLSNNKEAANKSHLVETNAAPSANISLVKQGQHPQQVHPQTTTNSISGSKRISFSEIHQPQPQQQQQQQQQQHSQKVVNNDGAEEAKKIYCMVDSRKSSQTSLHNVGNNLGQVQIRQLDSQGNVKATALGKVQLKTKEKLQSYLKPAGFLSQSPKAKKPSAASKAPKFYESVVQSQSSMLLTNASASNTNTSSSKLNGKPNKYVSQMQAAYAQANQFAKREVLKSSASQGGNSSFATAHKAILQIQAPKVVHLQSPPNRILVKASPRVSPNPKIRKQAIQTCKVSIDALQKNAGSSGLQSKMNRASSKEFLKTIKLMKRSSNSPSPGPSVLHAHYLKSSQGSPTSQSMQHKVHAHSNAVRVLKSSQNYDSTSQLKNYDSQPIERQLSSQGSKSTLARQTSQSSKLFSRLQMRKAKEAHIQQQQQQQQNQQYLHDPEHIASFSERVSQDQGKLRSSGSLLVQAASQSVLVQHQTSNLQAPQHQYSSNLVSPLNNSDELIKTTKAPKLYKEESAQGYQVAKKQGKSRLLSSKVDQVDARLQKPIEADDSINPSPSPRKPANLRIVPRSDSVPSQHQHAEEPETQRQVVIQSTPGKRVKTQQVVPVLVSHAIDEDQEEAKEEMIDSGKKSNEGRPPVNSVAVDPEQPSSQMTARPGSKAAANGGGVMTSMSNEEMREQAAFAKDLEKIRRIFKLHFQNYKTAPPTTNEFYRIGRVLGKGAFGKVSLAMHKLSEQLVAIKSMSRETLQSEVDQRRRTKLEMGILKQCNHPNVVRLFDTFETTKHICFVIELCSGGDLFLYIKKRRRLKEDVARFFFKQLVEGLAYIHNAKKVVHRDIKLENILLDATGNVKICDFGVSRQLQTGRERMKEQCGTPAYIAPEILLDQGYTGFKVDMWSAGVCLYAMLIGSVPFKASTMSQLQALIIKGEYDFKFQTNANSKNMQNPKAATTLLSEEVQDLINKLLQTDPNKRLSAVETLQHPWLGKTKSDLDVYTEKEKQLIQKEYMRLNLKLGSHSQRMQSSLRSCNSRVLSPSQSHLQQETEQALFTEHNLETRVGEEEPQMQNQEEKSYILAPFNSVKSMFIDQSNQIKELKKDDPPFKWPREVIDLIAPRRSIKFSAKCREKNRIYEQNNNADLDNGVYNEFVNEQEREEGALIKNANQQNQSHESISDAQKSSSPEQKRHMVSQEDEPIGLLDHQQSSEDSLERSFKETELASDDEEAEQQLAEQRRLLSNQKPNKEALSLLQHSDDEDGVLDTDEQVLGSPQRKHLQSPLAMTAGLQNKPLKSSLVKPSVEQNGFQKQKSRAQPRSGGPIASPRKVGQLGVAEYTEPEFMIDQEVVDRIRAGAVIPRSYLLSELQALTDAEVQQKRAAVAQSRDKSHRINYVTATYFLLVKRKELEDLQRRQESRADERHDDYGLASIEKSN